MLFLLWSPDRQIFKHLTNSKQFYSATFLVGHNEGTVFCFHTPSQLISIMKLHYFMKVWMNNSEYRTHVQQSETHILNALVIGYVSVMCHDSNVIYYRTHKNITLLPVSNCRPSKKHTNIPWNSFPTRANLYRCQCSKAVCTYGGSVFRYNSNSALWS